MVALHYPTEHVKILLVDDDLRAREILASTVARAGFTILMATTGAEGLWVASREHPDVILLDVMMPGMSGLEVCRELRQNVVLQDSTIIFVTALHDQEARMGAFAAGADDFISKPFDRIELITRLRSIQRLGRFRRLLQVRSQYEELVSLTPDAILAVDAAGLVTVANVAAGTLLGPVVGQEVSRLFTGGSDRGQWWRDILRQARPVANLETEFIRIDGTTFPGELTVASRGPEGEQGATVVVRDRSEQSALRQRVEQAQRLETVAQAAAGIAHDLSNYCLAAGEALACAEASLAGDATAAGHLTTARDVIGEAAGLARMLSRVGGPQEAQPRPHRLNQLVVETRSLLKALAAPARLEFELQADDAVRILVLQTDVQQVLTNLVCNARDAGGEDAGITIRTFQADEQDHHTPEGEWCYLEVVDRGGGMPPTVASNAFAPYFTTRNGAGLGLSIVHGIARRCGARLRLKTREGEGTSLRVGFRTVD
jgi:PAS domain S-box-containing protein